MKISWKWNKKKILHLRSLQGNSIIGVTKGKLTKSPQRGLKFRQEQMILFGPLTTGLNVFPEEEKLEIAIRSPRYCIQSCIQINTGVKLVFLECSHSRMRVQWLSLGKISRLKKKTKNTLGIDYEYVDSNYWLHSDSYGQDLVPRKIGKSFQTTSPTGLICVPAASW